MVDVVVGTNRSITKGTGSIPVSDSLVVRGDGCFEAVRSYDGRLFALDDHLARLAVSATAMDLQLPPLERLAVAAREEAGRGDGIVRLIVSRGDSIPGTDGETRVLVFHHPLPLPPREVSLEPVVAPWHPAGRAWDLAGIKTTSYAPNLAASRTARRSGRDDALLVTADGIVLEGPTFAVGWLRRGVLRTPSLDLGILASITRAHVLGLATDMGMLVEEGVFLLDDLMEATEVLAWSTVKEVTPVLGVGDREFARGPAGRALAEMFRTLVGQLTLPHGTGAE